MGWEAVEAIGRRCLRELMRYMRFVSDTERKDYKNIWNIEILVLGEIKCGKMRARKLSSMTLKFLAWSTE